MSVRDPFPTGFIVVGKGAAVARFYSAVSIGNDGLECIFHTVEKNHKGGVMKISQKIVKTLKKNNVRLRASLLLYKVLLLEFFARNV